MRIVRNDLKRAFCSPIFWLGVVAIVASGAINATRNVELLEQFDTPGTLNLFIFGNILFAGGIIGVILPLVAVLPYSTSLVVDMNSGFLKNQLVRVSSGKFIVQRIISTAISGGSVFLFAFLIYFIGAFIIDPSPSYRLSMHMAAFTPLYFDSLLLFCIVYILTAFLIGAAYALLGLGIGAITRKRFAALIIPAFLYHIGYFVLFLFPSYLREKAYNFIIFELFEFHNIQISIELMYLKITIIMVIGIVLTLISFTQYKKGKW